MKKNSNSIENIPEDPEWHWQQEALQRLGWSGLNGSADRQRAVWVVADLLKERQSA